MDINNLAKKIVILKQQAEMAGKMGNTKLRNDILGQMRSLADQAMEGSEDPSRYMLVTSVYSMLVQAYFDSDIKEATNYALDCLYKVVDLAKYENAEQPMTMLMGSILSVLTCLIKEFNDSPGGTTIREMLYKAADMLKAVLDKLIALNPSGMAALRGQKTLQQLKQANMLGKSGLTYKDINWITVGGMKTRYNYPDFDKLISDVKDFWQKE